MIKVDTSGVAAFRQQMKLEMARLDREITAAFVGWTVEVFRGLVERSPQWSGNMAANWNYSVHTPDFSYTQIANKTGDDGRIDHWRENQGIFQVGHPLAVGDAMARMQSVPKGTWRDLVYISNATPTEDGWPLAEAIEEGRVKLRPVNLIPGSQQLIAYTIMRESQRSSL